ncbi:hypothetical protein JB92DRAFT_2243603 [Gautieria morchelliformis]|nr:hypothetical protein JB92DRAFT_2243603 [Gautieria morchelliformis]
MSECLVYQLRPGRTMVGRLDSENPAGIPLTGDHILEEHCFFDNTDGEVTLSAQPNSTTFLNGEQLTVGQSYTLRSGSRIILGEHHVFRFSDPETVRKQRESASAELENTAASTPATPPDSPASDSIDDVDGTYAQREAAYARLGLDLDSMPDEGLNKLLERIPEVKTLPNHILRPRPESSLSQAHAVSSEFSSFSSDASTDDPSVETGHSDGSPENNELQDPLEAQNVQYQSGLQAITESTKAEGIRVENLTDGPNSVDETASEGTQAHMREGR